MTIIDGCIYIVYFLFCQYIIEKRKIPSILDFLDKITFGKLVILSIFVIGIFTSLSVIIHLMTYVAVLLTVFIASYLYSRYRSILEKHYQ